jgi:hybrid cluster-associated redox disulfide protein
MKTKIKKETNQKEISKKTKLSEIMSINNKAAEILFDEGMICMGCPMAMQETLEQGCLAHGMTKKEIDKLIVRLNVK